MIDHACQFSAQGAQVRDLAVSRATIANICQNIGLALGLKSIFLGTGLTGATFQTKGVNLICGSAEALRAFTASGMKVPAPYLQSADDHGNTCCLRPSLSGGLP